MIPPKTKKGNMALGVIMAFGGIAVGLLVFAVTMILFNIFLAQTKTMNIVYEGSAYTNDTNTTLAIKKIQTTGNTLIDWVQLAILIGIFGALISGLVFGGIFAWKKMQG